MALDCTSQAPARTQDGRGFKSASDRTVTESATNRVISKVDEITSLLRALASRERPSAKRCLTAIVATIGRSNQIRSKCARKVNRSEIRSYSGCKEDAWQNRNV
jgi:hypothetical protein